MSINRFARTSWDLMSLLKNIAVRISAAAASAMLLWAGFPKVDLAFLPWVGLVPLLLAIIGLRPVYGFLLSLLAGMIFFLGVFHWILAIPGYTFLHHGLLAVYLGSYFGAFGLAICFVSKNGKQLTALIAAPFLWVLFEYIRANLSFLSLPWGLLSHTQYEVPLVTQIASFTGASGVSFLIVLANAALAGTILTLTKARRNEADAPFTKLIPLRDVAFTLTALMLIIFNVLYGYVTISRPVSGERIEIALVQANIEQNKKWDKNYAVYIMETYRALTRKAALDSPALIVWPEAATPRAVFHDAKLYRDVLQIAQSSGTYLLFGSSHPQKFKRPGSKDLKFLNSAFLVPPDLKGPINQRYDKIRLLPFGEHLPYRDTIPWASINVPELTNYKPGTSLTVFEHPAFRFGVTICWESLFPDLFRQLVKKGAEIVINITNEAWFGDTAAPYQFLSMNVFRAIENRIFLVRCTNTGISCIIDPFGRVASRLMDSSGAEVFIRGILSGSVIPQKNNTVYTLIGDWLVVLCVVGSAGFLGFSFLNRKNNSQPAMRLTNAIF